MSENYVERILSFKMPRYNELPDMELYLDQVIAYIESSLLLLEENNNEKILTSSMVNNYVKKGIVPPTNKKKYSKEHIAYLFLVCIYKHIFSMDEICNMTQVHRDILQGAEGMTLERSYNYFCRELENILKSQFTNEELPLDTSVSLAAERYLIRNPLIAYANKIYSLKLLAEYNKSKSQ